MARTITDADRDAARRLIDLWNTAKEGRGFTQEEATSEFGWSQGAISGYLNAHIALGVTATFKFALFLRCSPRDIRPDLDEMLGALAGELSADAIELAAAGEGITDQHLKSYFRNAILAYPAEQAPDQLPQHLPGPHAA